MTLRLLIATNNPGKLAEMRELLGAVPFELVTLAEAGIAFTADEPFDTYLENATAKARAYAQASGLLALADDSGLEIDGMQGAPGVHSAHFGGTQTPYPERFALIEQRLAGLPPDQRTARYRCVMVLAESDPARPVLHVEGICEGVITPHPRGTYGFGYDPIFFLPDRGLTMAEVSSAEKNQISHRARAAQQMAAILQAASNRS